MNLSRPELSSICEFYIFSLFLVAMTAMWAQIGHEFYELYVRYSNS
jgi:hypothetical protein